MIKKKKTNFDVLEAIISMANGPRAVQEFRQYLLPKLPWSAKMHQELSDAEFEAALSHIRRELPHYLAWLRTANLPPLPPEFLSPSVM